MTILVDLFLAFAAGGVLSTFYFGGLWMTVQRAVTSDHAQGLLLASFVVRAGVVLLGFYLVILVAGTRWPILVASLVGFLAVRTVLIQRWRPRSATASEAT